MLLIAAGSLWLFLAAVPALADGGPHIASQNSGVSSLTTDSCAGCHRVHTAQAPLLLKTDEEGLCLSCHGAAVTGASTDVESGLQYGVDGTGDRDDTVLIGALRGGGFAEARIGDPAMFTYTSSRGVSKLSKVQVASVGEAVTSAHLPDIAGLTQPGIAWGNGANGSGAGPAATIGCASCHNPHGNGAYRILNPIPAGSGINAAWTVPIVDFGVDATDVYRTLSSHGLINGDRVTIAGGTVPAVAAPGAVVTVLSDTTFTVAGVATGGTGAGGTMTRVGGVKVTDDTTTNPITTTRNYTVIQTAAGTTGTPAASATLTAAEAQAFSATAGDYFHYRVPWNGTSGTNNDAPNGIAYSTSGTAVFNAGFNQQITAWCTSCHTRYWAWNEPTVDPDDDPTVGAAYANPRPGDDIFTYQHRTRGGSGRACTTCHVAHGSNAEMTGQYSSDYIWPNQVPDDIGVAGAGNANSRLLKVDNRGTCVLCHDPTGTIQLGDEFPAGASTLPAP